MDGDFVIVAEAEGIHCDWTDLHGTSGGRVWGVSSRPNILLVHTVPEPWRCRHVTRRQFEALQGVSEFERARRKVIVIVIVIVMSNFSIWRG
jgi:hypothetical protein